MKALFLAGGMGTRLRPLTDRVPKPMVPVMGKPLLERNIERLKSNGVDEVVLCTCYRAEDFEVYFGRSDPGLPVHYVTEDTPLGTGGAIKNAQRYFDHEAFLIFNADIVSDIDVGKMLRFHKRKKADVTIASTYVEDPTQYGVIEFDGDYAITFKEKPKPHEVISHYINAGVYIFEPDVLKMIPTGRAVSVEREVFPKLLENGKRIAVYKGCTYWLDLGTPEKYMQLHRDIFEGRCGICGADFCIEPVAGRELAKVHPSAVLRGPVFLGEGTRIEAGAIVGPNAVVGAHSIVGKKSAVENSILWDSVELAKNTQVSNSVITADCSVECGLRLMKSIYTGEAQKSLAVS
jgi:mannose-1-phosphate guanylyltransferase